MLRWTLPHLFVGLVAGILAFVPLFQVLGFEFAVALGVAFAYGAGWMAAGDGAGARRAATTATTSSAGPDVGADVPFPGDALLRSLIANLSLLTLPLAIALLNALRVPNCDVASGVRFYLVIGVPALLYGTTLGFLLGLRFSTRRARLAFVVWSLATMAWTLWNVVREPPIFAFNAFVAWFPGPVYDRYVALEPRLLIARGIVVVEALVFLCLSLVLWDGKQVRWRTLRTRPEGWRAVPLVVGAVAALTFALTQVYASDLGLRVHRRAIQEALGGRIETAHCIVYYDQRAYTPARAAELAAEHEFHYEELAAWFGTAPERKVRGYVYASAQQKKRLMGAAGTNFEDALNDEFHINAATYPHPVLRHEMAHIFAAHIDRWWPVCPLMGIHEGLAVAAEWRTAAGSGELTPDEACVAMQELGVLPDLTRSLSAFGFWTQASARVYTVAGSFLHFLIEEHGMPAAHRLWSSRDFEETYGKPLDQLIGDWQQQRLDPIHLTPRQVRLARQRYLRRSVFQEPCAHEQARLRREAATALSIDPPQADSLYAELAAIEPQRAAARLGQVRARLRTRDAIGALEMAEDLWSSNTLSVTDSTRLLHWQGDALWLADSHAEAETLYTRALERAARRAARRALQVNLAVLQSPVLRDLLRDYLIESNQNDTASLTLLATARARDPESIWPRYLLGRRLYFAERFVEARQELQAVLQGVLPEDIRLAALEMQAWAALRGGDAAGARDLVRDALGAPHIAASDLPQTAARERPQPHLPWSAAEVLRLEDLLRRAEARLR